MDSHFAVAQLSPELLSEIQQLENKLRNSAKENIVLIAYAENGAEQDNHSPASPV
ncbi:hypothetical protein N0M98_16830 [Paenibacillus doosanensis]|uniref:Uncharacterized protein n=1 Tax=Paenibacillus konkukensis TaxID=2020716 RepID=A0ABY4S0F4_9BACL|nr:MULTISPECIES: hypothetical protein [Paenibacillus]MCS7461802.1 hypothetical protein [Paenibacillus doosanensis]UQZ87430.1 hypothetical protein SK3146_06727 [Paenibacillus konkukensis]